MSLNDKCKHCGKRRGNHKAQTFNCPFGRSRNFPQYSKQTFELAEPRTTSRAVQQGKEDVCAET